MKFRYAATQGMKTISETITETAPTERASPEHGRVPPRIAEARIEIAFLRRRLTRLTKLQTLLKQKYHNRLAELSRQTDEIDSRQWELRSLGRQLKKNRERQAIIREELTTLERRRRTIQEAAKQIERYRQSSNAQVSVIEEEQEVLSQRIYDLEHTLELIEQAELDNKELDTVSQRMKVTRGLLEEHAADLSKRTIDLLFEFYVPARNNRRFRF
jgi:chromosome segregation ATPase